jgi:MoaA/NifB/PqqE/SkfB family radical SAM enzyme
LYRKNVKYNKVIENATAFIQAGGRAQWNFIVFKHNEHQVEAARQLAQSMGFKWFRAKVSKRPTVAGLEYPVNFGTDYRKKSGYINCISKKENSIFISATGTVSACCWLGEKKIDVSSFEKIVDSWNSKQPHEICDRTCRTFSSDSEYNSFKHQWRLEVELQKS